MELSTAPITGGVLLSESHTGSSRHCDTQGLAVVVRAGQVCPLQGNLGHSARDIQISFPLTLLPHPDHAEGQEVIIVIDTSHCFLSECSQQGARTGYRTQSQHTTMIIM